MSFFHVIRHFVAVYINLIGFQNRVRDVLCNIIPLKLLLILMSRSISNRHHISLIRIQFLRLRIIVIAERNDMSVPDSSLSGKHPGYLKGNRMVGHCIFHRRSLHDLAEAHAQTVHLILRHVRAVKTSSLRPGQIICTLEVQHGQRHIGIINRTIVNAVVLDFRIPDPPLFHLICLLLHRSDGHKGILVGFHLSLIRNQKLPADTAKPRRKNKQQQKQGGSPLHTKKLTHTILKKQHTKLLPHPAYQLSALLAYLLHASILHTKDMIRLVRYSLVMRNDDHRIAVLMGKLL